MKIKVTTSVYDYMGLSYGTEVEAVSSRIGSGFVACFNHNGKMWQLPVEDFAIIQELPNNIDTVKPIKSDGGSSAYYDFKVPQHYLDLIAEAGIIKTEYLIDIIFGNDFDFACAFKALVRAKGITEGAGKEGNTLDYELNKMDYYESKIKEKYGWKNDR
jgi:hypothetical protein